MPLPELLAGLAEYIGDDPAKAKEVARALRDSKAEHAEQLNPLAQVLIDVGAGKKKGQSDTAIAEKQAEIDRLTGELEAATEAAEAASKKPNELQADFDRRREKLEAKALKAEADLKAEREGRRNDRVGITTERVLAELKGLVTDDYRDDEIVRGRIARRIRPTDTGVEVLDEHETPYDGNETQQTKAFAADFLKTVPELHRLRNMNAGGGASGAGGTTTVTQQQRIEEQARSGKFSLL